MPQGSTSPLRRWTSLAVLLVLALSLVLGLAPNVDTRLVQVGETLWPGYALQLRADPVAPDCDIRQIQQDIGRCAEPETAPGAALPPPPAQDAFGGQDPFAEAPSASGTPARAGCEALPQLLLRCEQRHQEHKAISERLSPSVRAFRAVENSAAALARLPAGEILLSLLLILGAFSATLEREHIGLRRPTCVREDRVSETAQALANAFLLASCVADQLVQRGSEVKGADPILSAIWALGFGVLLLLNLIHLARPRAFPAELRREGRAPAAGLRLLLLPPLYAWLTVATGFWFVFVERHPSGQAIYLHKFVQHPSIYLGVGLYVWSGMLFSHTRIARLGFDGLHPFRLPPPLLCWLTGIVAAVPTAFSGASGIFVISAGREIFEKLRLAGASRRLAYAATAMSGSLGVVLRPCLLVVLVAALNKQVTTDALYSGGLRVFALTVGLYGVAMLARTRRPLLGAPLGQALPASARALLPMLPYLGVGAAILAALGLGLGVWLNEFTAPLLVPLVLVGAVAWESRVVVREKPSLSFLPDLGRRLLGASSSSSGNAGALLLLMTASIGLGGVIERAEWMSLLPATLGSPFATMALLVLVLIGIGMIMDPMGAVVLVSVTIAETAYNAGIDPVHFWMVVLVAFELGYLTPPVALNQLLTRQVVGREAEVENDPLPGFWARHDHVITPVAIVGTALLLVAFVPLMLSK